MKIPFQYPTAQKACPDQIGLKQALFVRVKKVRHASRGIGFPLNTLGDEKIYSGIVDKHALLCQNGASLNNKEEEHR